MLHWFRYTFFILYDFYCYRCIVSNKSDKSIPLFFLLYTLDARKSILIAMFYFDRNPIGKIMRIRTKNILLRVELCSFLQVPSQSWRIRGWLASSSTLTEKLNIELSSHQKYNLLNTIMNNNTILKLEIC